MRAVRALSSDSPAARPTLARTAEPKGNCAELASALRAFLDASGTTSRWIHEINVQPQPTPRRQNAAAAMVAQRGLSYSIFGLQHNDHMWLEVWDDATKWFPADPANDVVGLNEWLPARLAMANRTKPRVAAVAPIAAEMLVPFVVAAGETRSGPYTDDRTDTYLIDGFNNLYGGRLSVAVVVQMGRGSAFARAACACHIRREGKLAQPQRRDREAQEDVRRPLARGVGEGNQNSITLNVRRHHSFECVSSW